VSDLYQKKRLGLTTVGTTVGKNDGLQRTESTIGGERVRGGRIKVERPKKGPNRSNWPRRVQSDQIKSDRPRQKGRQKPTAASGPLVFAKRVKGGSEGVGVSRV